MHIDADAPLDTFRHRTVTARGTTRHTRAVRARRGRAVASRSGLDRAGVEAWYTMHNHVTCCGI